MWEDFRVLNDVDIYRMMKNAEREEINPFEEDEYDEENDYWKRS